MSFFLFFIKVFLWHKFIKFRENWTCGLQAFLWICPDLACIIHANIVTSTSRWGIFIAWLARRRSFCNFKRSHTLSTLYTAHSCIQIQICNKIATREHTMQTSSFTNSIFFNIIWRFFLIFKLSKSSWRDRRLAYTYHTSTCCQRFILTICLQQSRRLLSFFLKTKCIISRQSRCTCIWSGF